MKGGEAMPLRKALQNAVSPSVLVLSIVLASCAGREPDAVTVPDVVGLSLSEAAEAIMEVGLFVDTPSVQQSSAVPKDHVIDQTPAAGDSMPVEGIVSLVVSNGPVPVTDDRPPVTETETDGEAEDSACRGLQPGNGRA
jgi:beta-lactam-binding protein with PASTA domain